MALFEKVPVIQLLTGIASGEEYPDAASQLFWL